MGMILAEPFVRQRYAELGNLFTEHRNRYLDMRELTPHVRYTPEVIDHGGKRHTVMWIDEEGFIKPSKRHENPDFNMVFLGGSTTECAQVEEENRFPYLVGRKLEVVLDKKINSYNAGRSANNSMHANLTMLAKIIPLKPKFALIMHNVNDISIVLQNGSYWNKETDDRRLLKELPPIVDTENIGFTLRSVKNTLFPYGWNFISSKINLGKGQVQNSPSSGMNVLEETDIPITATDISIDTDKAKEEFINSLKVFISLSRIYGIEPVLITQGHLRLIDKQNAQALLKNKQNLALISYFNQSIIELGQQENVLVIDVDKAVRENSNRISFFYDTVHYRDEGSRFVAEVISKALLENNYGVSRLK